MTFYYQKWPKNLIKGSKSAKIFVVCRFLRLYYVIKGLLFSEISISETQTVVMNRESLPCKHYAIETEHHNQNTEFVDCSIKNLWLKLQSKVECTVPGLSAIFKSKVLNNTIGECTNTAVALEAITNTIIELYLLWATPSDYGCPIPCTTIGYTFDLIYYHSSIPVIDYLDIEEESFGLNVFYKTLMTEERTETLIYDVTGFLTATGGNLGLMLGFSCFAVLCSILQHIQNYIVH
jgi:hypothetical protein